MLLRRCGSGVPVVLVALLAVQLCWRTVIVAADEEQAAREWLEKFYLLAERRQYASAVASWNFQVNITEENNQRVIEESTRLAEFSKEAYENISQFNWQNFTDKNITRQLSFLINSMGVKVLPVDELLRAKKLESEMQTIYSMAALCKRPSDIGTKHASKCYPLSPDVKHIMATSRDWEELTWAWREWRSQTGRKMKNKYSEFVEIHNKAARVNGYADTGDYWRSAFEMDDFKERIEQLWLQVRPLYQQLHAYVRRKLLDAYPQYRDRFPATGHIPAHLTGNMWAQTWSNIMDLVIPFANTSSPDVTKELVEQGYNATAMFHLADQFFVSLGLERVPQLFWENSMLEKPKDGRKVVCHASAWDFFNGRDFRIKQCTEVTSEHLLTVHHEMGHVQYYLLYRHQPLPYRQGANPGFHEAVGDVMSLSVNTPEHLQTIGFMQNFVDTEDADINFLMNQALDKVAFLPFGYLIDKWRWQVFEGVTTSETYNTDWWKLRCSLEGVSPPVVRNNEDFDAGSKFHVPNNTPYIRYFVSFIIQFQFHKALCQAANVQRPLHRCDIYESREAGDLLRRTLVLGSSKPWPDAMEVMTGQRHMDAGPLLEYFQPLHDWLRQQNAGYDVTWDDDCPPGSFAESRGFRLAAADRCAIFTRALVYATAMSAGVLLRMLR